MELNVKQKSVVDLLNKEYKSETVTRAQINALVKKKVIKNPSWLKSDKFKVDRGVYTLNIDSDKSDTKKEINTNPEIVKVITVFIRKIEKSFLLIVSDKKFISVYFLNICNVFCEVTKD